MGVGMQFTQSYHGEKHSKYGDPEIVRHSGDRTEFIPFTRTTAVLDPEHADDPVPVSREQTKIL